MRILQNAGDRLLSLFAPKSKAVAHCLFTSYSCIDGVWTRCDRDQCEDTIVCTPIRPCGTGEG